MMCDDSIFSFPPYLSTTWEHVAAVSMHPSGRVEIALNNGSCVLLPDISPDQTDAIFQCHKRYLSKKISTEGRVIQKFGMGLEIPGSGAIPLQHNPLEAGGSHLPEEFIEKLAEITKATLPKEILSDFTPEPHCHCTFCEIARAANPGVEELVEIATPKEETIANRWIVQQVSEKLYTVSSSEDPAESYSVFLGQPIGCTCGKADCVHIISVLKS
jgi:hypothetical protein